MKVVGKRIRFWMIFGLCMGSMFVLIGLLLLLIEEEEPTQIAKVLFFIGGALFIVAIIDICSPSKFIFIEGDNILIKPSAKVTVTGPVKCDKYYVIPFASIKKIVTNNAPKMETPPAYGILGGALGFAGGTVIQAASGLSKSFISIHFNESEIVISNIITPDHVKKEILLHYRSLLENIDSNNTL